VREPRGSARRIQALASLIEQLDGHRYAKAHGVVLSPNTGKLASLVPVLAHLGSSGHESAISVLRVIPALCNQAPALPKFDGRMTDLTAND
jgi:hypothetical protein